MFTVLLSAVLSGALGARFFFDRQLICFSVLGATLFSSCGGGIGVGLALGLGRLVERTVQVGEFSIVAVRTTDSLSGSFVWGTGDVSGNSIYRFMYRVNDGRVSPGSVIADYRVQIKEEQRADGKLITTYTIPEKDNPFLPWVFTNEVEIVKHEFFVPQNSVVQNYSLK